MLSHNSYFDGRVQSLGFEREGRKATVGVMAAGDYHFSTGAPERMTVISGELAVRRADGAAFTTYPAGTSFEVSGESSFDVTAVAATAYLCEFL